VQVQEIAQPFEFAQAVWYLTKLVVTEIERSQVTERADALRDFGEAIVGQDKRLQVSSVPHLIGHGTQCSAPER
jgi:hypothetical protein